MIVSPPITGPGSLGALGALLMHLMLETMVAAQLLGVNAFDQPAVEEGKQIARDYLRGMGGEQLS